MTRRRNLDDGNVKWTVRCPGASSPGIDGRSMTSPSLMARVALSPGRGRETNTCEEVPYLRAGEWRPRIFRR